MPRYADVIGQFSKLLNALKSERARLVARVAQIDAALTTVAARPGPAAKLSLLADAAGRGRKKRGRFSETAEAMILNMVRKQGKVTSMEISKAWRAGKRGGQPGNTLTKLVNSKQLKRTKVAGGRGSHYELGDKAPAAS